MASLMFSIASSKVSPWLWQPGSAGQCASYPYSLLFITTVYFMFLIYHTQNGAVKALNSDFNKVGRVEGLFGFHYFKPAFNGFFNVSDGFIISLTLRKTSGEGRHFSNIIAGLILFNLYMQFHLNSFLNRSINKIYHMNYMTVKTGGLHDIHE